MGSSETPRLSPTLVRDNPSLPEALFVTTSRKRLRAALSSGEKHSSVAAGGQGLHEERTEHMSPEFERSSDGCVGAAVETENMKLRSSLLRALKEQITAEGLTQRQAADRFGITQPRISHLMRGRIEFFGIDTLVKMLANAGFRVELQVIKSAQKLDAGK